MNKSALIFLILVIGLVQIVGATELLEANFTATPTSGVAPLTVQFTDTSTGNPTRWLWNFKDGTTSDLQNPPPHTYLIPGSYGVILYVYTNTQSAGIAWAIEVKSSEIVANFIANPTSGTAPLTVQFTDTSTGNITGWGWDFMDGSDSHSILKNPSHTYSHACNYQTGNGTYPFMHWVYDGYTRSGKNGIIVLNVPPSPVSSFTATPTSGPAPLTVQFTDTSSNNPTGWRWGFGDGTASNLKNPPQHTYTLSGVYTVTMQATSTDVCTQGNLANTTITVLSPLAPGTTTSSTPTSTQTTTLSPTTTTATSTAAGTTIQTAEPTTSATTPPTTSISTLTSSRTPTSKVTLKTFTPYPTDTPTQPSPLGVEIGIIAMMIIAVLVVKRK